MVDKQNNEDLFKDLISIFEINVNIFNEMVNEKCIYEIQEEVNYYASKYNLYDFIPKS